MNSVNAAPWRDALCNVLNFSVDLEQARLAEACARTQSDRSNRRSIALICWAVLIPT